MANVAIKSAGALGGYGAALAKPSGSGPCYVTLLFTFFFADDTPSVSGQSGWTLLDKITDAFGSNQNATTAIFGKYVSDLSSEPSSYTITLPGGTAGDLLGQAVAWDNVDPTTPVATTTKVSRAAGAVTITVPNATVGRAGSASVLSCGDWDTGDWRMSGSGGTQTAPSGFTAADPATTSEFAYFYQTGLSVGNVGGSFGTTGSRFAIVQAVLQPAVSTAVLQAIIEAPFID